MNKKMLYVITGILVMLAAWYFFVKDYDYQITFKSKNPKGFVYNNIKTWNNNRPVKDTMVKTISSIPFSEIQQKYYPAKDSTINIKWELDKINDSLTKIIGYFKSDHGGPLLRTQLLFSTPDFVKQSLDFAKGLNRRIKSRSKLYKLSDVDTIMVPSKQYVYVLCDATLQTKAKSMIANNGYVLQYLRKNNLELTDFPFVDIQSWNKQTDSIRFKFCFPIKTAHQSQESDIKFDERPQYKALRIRFNGNYSKSHMAWYAFNDYFEANHSTEQQILPTEIFLDDPNQGGEDIQWRADIVLPLNQIDK
ncbi:MAG: hypothetical protein AAFX55_00250 [Bacteroidota bacterium]